MSLNSFGHMYKVMTWGESHGPSLGATIDGCPPGIEINQSKLQVWMDKRKPGQNKYTTQRNEPDSVEILSGVFEGVSTGTPIQLIIRNTDQRSTARETAARVAAGGVARLALKHLAPNLEIYGYMTQMGDQKIDRSRIDLNQIDNNPFWCPDLNAANSWKDYLEKVRKSRDSVGAVIEIIAKNVSPGLGAPIYGKIDTDLAAAMMSINAVKGVEVGEGMNAASLLGSENADEIFMDVQNRPRYSSNHSGGILGGITTGQDIIVRFAVKPTSSILSPKKTITQKGEETEIITKGRHDPCVGIRAVPVGEAMMACVLLDHYLLHRGQIGENGGQIG